MKRIFIVFFTFLLFFLSYSQDLEKFEASDLHKERTFITLFDKKIPSPYLTIIRKLFQKFSNFDYYFSKNLSLLQSVIQKDANFPCILIMTFNKDGERKFNTFSSKKDFNYPSILKWIERILPKDPKIKVKKEEILELDELNYQDVVKDPKKDVLVKVYADWCKHCQKLKVVYENIGKFFKDVDNLIVAKIDGHSHKIPVKILGFPTFLFYQKGNKKPIHSNSIDTEEDLIKFVQKNSIASKNQVKSMKWNLYEEKDEL